jgi:hypothetical protein
MMLGGACAETGSENATTRVKMTVAIFMTS